eukprot:1588-Heterococcus_DN1.PRE.8
MREAFSAEDAQSRQLVVLDSSIAKDLAAAARTSEQAATHLAVDFRMGASHRQLVCSARNMIVLVRARPCLHQCSSHLHHQDSLTTPWVATDSQHADTKTNRSSPANEPATSGCWPQRLFGQSQRPHMASERLISILSTERDAAAAAAAAAAPVV